MMSARLDEPREILSILNSLGFIGITAPQLKAFIKDLKTYRKIKERERQEWKDEAKKKILSANQCDIKDIINVIGKECSWNSEYTGTSDFSNNCDETSLIEVNIQCIPKKEEQIIKQSSCTKAVQVCTKSKQDVKHSPEVKLYNQSKTDIQSTSRNIDGNKFRIQCNSLNSVENNSQSNKENHLRNSSPVNSRVKPIDSGYKSVASGSNLNGKSRLHCKSTSSDLHDVNSIPSIPPILVSSRPKSFIRPWRLQKEARKTAVKKCDPVALYHKYQEEWKKINFPGEEKYANVRWAIREKMLGVDPAPMSLSRRKISTGTIDKR
ncbi:centriolar and ciliogenesis-associated protein hyls-1 [Prorops nasuta]|uniref:centriolar and ciliogenesis-associated protein hyls-1 n=1 Tax=Prorops nasuta TaxID=863751 RepID=UPI0034CE1E40